jgi:hypothetical protein
MRIVLDKLVALWELFIDRLKKWDTSSWTYARTRRRVDAQVATKHHVTTFSVLMIDDNVQVREVETLMIPFSTILLASRRSVTFLPGRRFTWTGWLISLNWIDSHRLGNATLDATCPVLQYCTVLASRFHKV